MNIDDIKSYYSIDMISRFSTIIGKKKTKDDIYCMRSLSDADPFVILHWLGYELEEFDLQVCDLCHHLDMVEVYRKADDVVYVCAKCCVHTFGQWTK